MKSKVFVGALLLVLVLAVIPSISISAITYPFEPTQDEVAKALDYLRGQQTAENGIGGFGSSAWVMMAIATAGEDPHDWKADGISLVDYLRAHANEADVSKATDVARMILAITAAGEDPENFGGINFVEALKATYGDNQIGDNARLNDDFWGVMALIAAGESPNSELILNSVRFIKEHQDEGGGWAWDVAMSWGTDVDDTASAIMALIAAGEAPTSSSITNGLNYLKSQQTENGGFLSWGATNASTDAIAICAIVAAEQDPTGADWIKNGKTPIDDLLTFRQADGSFYLQIGIPGNVPLTTSRAIQALLGKPFPVKPVAKPEAKPFPMLLAAIVVIVALAIGIALYLRRK